MSSNIKSVNHVFFVSLPWHPVNITTNLVILLISKPSRISQKRYNLALKILYKFDYKVVLLTCSVGFLLQLPQQDPSSLSQGAHTLLKTEWGQVSKNEKKFVAPLFEVLFATDLFHDLPGITDLGLLIFAIKIIWRKIHQRHLRTGLQQETFKTRMLSWALRKICKVNKKWLTVYHNLTT